MAACSGYEVSASLETVGSTSGTKPHGEYVEGYSKLESLVQQANGLCWVENPGKYTAANAIAFLENKISVIWSGIYVPSAGESAKVEANSSEPSQAGAWLVDAQGSVYCHVGRTGTTVEYAYGVASSVTYTVYIYLNPVD